MTDWIAVDWGTSRLRAWAMGADGSVLQAAQSDMGMGALTPAGFETALLEVAGEWIEGPTRVVACGITGECECDAGWRGEACDQVGAGV